MAIEIGLKLSNFSELCPIKGEKGGCMGCGCDTTFNPVVDGSDLSDVTEGSPDSQTDGVVDPEGVEIPEIQDVETEENFCVEQPWAKFFASTKTDSYTCNVLDLDKIEIGGKDFLTGICARESNRLFACEIKESSSCAKRYQLPLDTEVPDASPTTVPNHPTNVYDLGGKIAILYDTRFSPSYDGDYFFPNGLTLFDLANNTVVQDVALGKIVIGGGSSELSVSPLPSSRALKLEDHFYFTTQNCTEGTPEACTKYARGTMLILGVKGDGTIDFDDPALAFTGGVNPSAVAEVKSQLEGEADKKLVAVYNASGPLDTRPLMWQPEIRVKVNGVIKTVRLEIVGSLAKGDAPINKSPNIAIFDVTEPADPKLLRTIEIDPTSPGGVVLPELVTTDDQLSASITSRAPGADKAPDTYFVDLQGVATVKKGSLPDTEKGKNVVAEGYSKETRLIYKILSDGYLCRIDPQDMSVKGACQLVCGTPTASVMSTDDSGNDTMYVACRNFCGEEGILAVDVSEIAD